MADNSFPPQHTTTTTVTSNTRVQTNIRYDPLVVRKIDGMLKVAQLVFSLLGFICIQCTHFSAHPTGKFYSIISMFGVWATGILLVLYLFHIVEKLYKIPWIKVELVYCSVLALMYLIGSCMVAPLGVAAFEAAAFFGFSCMCLYAADAFMKYKAHQAGELAQGERQITKETSAVSPGWNVP